jgi:hypothetical protein
VLDVALDCYGWLAPAAIEERNGSTDAFTRRAKSIDKGGERRWRVLTGKSLNTLRPTAWIAGLAFLELRHA